MRLQIVRLLFCAATTLFTTAGFATAQRGEAPPPGRERVRAELRERMESRRQRAQETREQVRENANAGRGVRHEGAPVRPGARGAARSTARPGTPARGAAMRGRGPLPQRAAPRLERLRALVRQIVHQELRAHARPDAGRRGGQEAKGPGERAGLRGEVGARDGRGGPPRRRRGAI